MWLKIKADIINLDSLDGVLLGETKITFVGKRIAFEYTDKKLFPKGNLTTEEFQKMRKRVIEIFEENETINYEEITKEG